MHARSRTLSRERRPARRAPALRAPLVVIAVALLAAVLACAALSLAPAAAASPSPLPSRSATPIASAAPAPTPIASATPVDRGSIVTAGNDAVLQQGQTADSVVVLGGNATIAGTVRNAVVVVGGDVTLRSTAVVGSAMGSRDAAIVVVGGDVTRDPGAVVTGKVNTVSLTAPHLSLFGGLGHLVTHPRFSLAGWFAQMLSLLIVAVAVAALMPTQVRGVGARVLREPLASLGWGALATFVVLPIGGFILFVSIIGWLVLIPAGFIAFLVYLFAGAAMATLLGTQVLQRSGAPAPNLLGAAALGALLLSIMRAVPLVGGLAFIVISAVGFGAACIVFVDWRRRRQAANAVAQDTGG